MLFNFLYDYIVANITTLLLRYRHEIFNSYVISRVHNIIEEESVLLSNILYKRVLQSYDVIVIVTFEVLSDHTMFWKHIDIFVKIGCP